MWNADTRDRLERLCAEHPIALHWPEYSGSFPENPCVDFGRVLFACPGVVLRPADRQALVACLVTLQQLRIPIKLRALAHSSGGQVLSDGGAVVDLTGMDRILEVGPDSVRVECGTSWLTLARHLHPHSRPAVLTDNWRTTVGGTLAVGGFGDTSHRCGLQIQAVDELVVATVDGGLHRVGPGDPLFDHGLGGRGELGVMVEAVVRTIQRGPSLLARVLTWKSVTDWLADGPVLSERFELVRARLSWSGGGVSAAAGNLVTDASEQGALSDGLRASHSPLEHLDTFAAGSAPPDARWQLACPALEFVLPLPDGLAALAEIRRRICASSLAEFLPRGSSIVRVPAAPELPQAPLPPGPHSLMVALRPEVPQPEARSLLPQLHGIGRVVLESGGRIYPMSIPLPGAAERRVETETWRSLKARYDPHGILNAGGLSLV